MDKPIGCVVVHGKDAAGLSAAQDLGIFATIEALLDGVRRGDMTRLQVVLCARQGPPIALKKREP